MSIDPKLNESPLKQFLITSLSVALGTVALTILPQSVLAATLYTQAITLSPGWNTVSTPLVLASHAFSAAENSSNFDIYVLDASQTSGWATMAQEGQTEFTPLHGYFIDNKTGVNQTLTFSYLASTTPAQRLFERKFTTPGWYSIGVSNPTFALPITAASSTHTGNVSPVLAALGSNYDTLIDLTDGDSDIQSPAVASSWKAVTPSTMSLLNDLRETKGYGIHVSAAGGVYDGFQNDQAPIVTLTTVQNAASVASQNVGVNIPNTVLGGFTTNVTGAPVTISGLTLGIATSSTGTGLITLVSIFDENGAVVAGPVDTTGAGNLLTFSNSIVFPVGSHTYTVKGKLPATFTTGGVVTLNTAPNGLYATNGVTAWANPINQATGASITVDTSNFTMNTMTVRGATLSVSASQSPSSQSIVAGGQNITFANIQLDASQSGEDIQLSSFPLYLTTTDGTAAAGSAQGYLSSCQLWDGTTALNTGSDVKNSLTGGTGTTNSINFTNGALKIPKGTVKTLAVTCNLSSTATSGTYAFGVHDNPTVIGVSSGTTLSGANLVVNAGNSGTMTVSSGATVAVSIDPSSPSYAVQADGTTGVTVGVIKLRASNEALNLTKIGLTLANSTTGKTGSGATSNAAGDLVTVYLYNGSTLLGTATFTGSSNYATSTLTTPFNIPRDVNTQITLKADLANIGISSPGGIGDLIKVDPSSFEGTGASSGSTIKGATASNSVSAGVAGVRLFSTYPTFALDTLPTTGVADGRLLHFKVTASSAGPVGIDQFGFTVSWSGLSSGSVNGLNLYGFTDSAYSQPISGQGAGGLVNGSVDNPASGVAFTLTSSTTPIEVPAGQTYYFELRGTVPGVTSGSSVVTTLNGDSAQAAVTAGYQMAPVSGLTAGSKFIWSDNATTTSGTTAVDWTNGFSAPGLPSSGLIQTRSN